MLGDIKKVLTVLNQTCYYCGCNRILAEIEINDKSIITGKDGKQRAVRNGKKLITSTICSNKFCPSN